ncbi:hypothetical protein DSCOOX_00840 [Desulfosarcina ovata subsp. ovata]|uniref:Uncharacterized protein n=2 Tax=Desulfosarcina ovata TaxID=83564 RepID=A0A5K8A3H5_9BACT|nr:hypothetical protein DSCOOX_00840 [Desulfosarcina ovata subsp. ovata]
MAKRGIWDPKYIIGDLQRGKVRAICINSSIRDPNQLTTSRIGNQIIEIAKSTHKYELKIYNRYIYFYSEDDWYDAMKRINRMNTSIPHRPNIGTERDKRETSINTDFRANFNRHTI